MWFVHLRQQLQQPVGLKVSGENSRRSSTPVFTQDLCSSSQRISFEWSRPLSFPLLLSRLLSSPLLLPQLSYRGRVLVGNNLAASALWHRFNVLTPPRNLIDDIQRAIVDFFWSGKHWVRAAVLYLPVAEGGQGLINVRARIASSRLRTAQKILYTSGPGGSRWPGCC